VGIAQAEEKLAIIDSVERGDVMLKDVWLALPEGKTTYDTKHTTNYTAKKGVIWELRHDGEEYFTYYAEDEDGLWYVLESIQKSPRRWYVKADEQGNPLRKYLQQVFPETQLIIPTVTDSTS